MIDAPNAELRAARKRMRLVADDLGGLREFGPMLAIVNPPRWELGHVGWFQEYWCLRRTGAGRYTEARGDPILPNADALYNSAVVPHDARWSLPLPAFDATLQYRDSVLERVLERISQSRDDDDLYFARLASRHEDMHAEAFHYTRQTLGYPAPAITGHPHPPGAPASGDAECGGGQFPLGADHGAGFVFDNEKWSHPVLVRPFRIARAAVTNGQFREFVEAGGYRNAGFWSPQGRIWLDSARQSAPAFWRRADGAWQVRRFDSWVALAEDDPVVHVNFHEAEAYCRFAGRRLPTESEWEHAATWDPREGRKRAFPWGDGPWQPDLANIENAALAGVHAYPGGDSPCGVRQMIGNVWEWTATPFLPYPGFLRDPYKEYSEPWFGTHRVLRGGCFATSRRIACSAYRNFFTPDRSDVFAGFRTCAIDRP